MPDSTGNRINIGNSLRQRTAPGFAFIPLALLLAVSSPCVAQELPSEMDIFADIPLVSSATRRPAVLAVLDQLDAIFEPWKK